MSSNATLAPGWAPPRHTTPVSVPERWAGPEPGDRKHATTFRPERGRGFGEATREAGPGEAARDGRQTRHRATPVAHPGTAPLRVHVSARDTRARAGVLALLRRANLALAAQPDRSPETVVVAAGGTVDEAIEACPAAYRSGDYRLIVVADRFSPTGVRRAVRAGAQVLVGSTEVTPARLAAAVRSAVHGYGRIAYETLVRLINEANAGEPAPAAPVAARPAVVWPVEPLTARQTTVLRLIAEGHGNAAIADTLTCSEHTVKNVIYDLMARLQVRNRAHAVARGVRAGLI
ncbi:response regulator transcription factor [Micromonospora sp. NPDC093277]|uniref:helix-turn-helix transcriptional regulator n=1 Tax=Micromonospora sp. NPDC093277 TaxID=3364291 RepID=UPI003828CC99